MAQNWQPVLALALLVATTPAARAAPPGITPSEGRWVLDGKAPVYIYLKDTEAGESRCTGPCAKEWTPFVAAADAVASDGWTVVKQADGRRLWAYRGHVVYKFAEKALGPSTQWTYIDAPMRTPEGVVVKDGAYYTADGVRLSVRSSFSELGCEKDCAIVWKALPAPAGATSIDGWSVVSSKDGTQHWAVGSHLSTVYVPTGQQPPPPARGKPPAYIPPMEAPPLMTVSHWTLMSLPADAKDYYDPAVTKRPTVILGQHVDYPAASRRANEQGTVNMQFCIGPDGAMTDSFIASSSGFDRLDRASVDLFRQATFHPGEIDGTPVKICGVPETLAWNLRN